MCVVRLLLTSVANGWELHGYVDVETVVVEDTKEHFFVINAPWIAKTAG